MSDPKMTPPRRLVVSDRPDPTHQPVRMARPMSPDEVRYMARVKARSQAAAWIEAQEAIRDIAGRDDDTTWADRLGLVVVAILAAALVVAIVAALVRP